MRRGLGRRRARASCRRIAHERLVPAPHAGPVGLRTWSMSWTSDNARSELSNLLKQHAQGAEELSDKTELVADLGIDSLGVMELVADVEDKFDLAIEDAELREIVTVGDVLGAIEKRLRDAGRWQE